LRGKDFWRGDGLTSAALDESVFGEAHCKA